VLMLEVQRAKSRDEVDSFLFSPHHVHQLERLRECREFPQWV